MSQSVVLQKLQAALSHFQARRFPEAESLCREATRAITLENLNVETRDLLPLTNQPYKKLYGEDFEDRFPVANWVKNHGFYVGCHPYMTDEEIDFVIDAMHDFYRQERAARKAPSRTAQWPSPKPPVITVSSAGL